MPDTTTRPTTTATLWVCIDCAMTEASGQLPDGFDENGQSGDERRPEPWSALGDDQVHVTPGLVADEHDDECPNYGYEPCAAGCDDGDAAGPDEPYRACEACDGDGHGKRMEWSGEHDEPCDTAEFSWSQCDGCGSTLGGSRYGYTLHGVHTGHFSRIGGTYWCDTCDSPYCELA